MKNSIFVVILLSALFEGEDEDKRVHMKTESLNKLPIAGANIRIINGTDTFVGQTNAVGNKTFLVPNNGLYDVHITCPQFQTLDTTIAVYNQDIEATFELTDE